MTTRSRTTVTTTELAVLPTWSIPRGRSKAEHRLAAIAALHMPVPRHYPAQVTGGMLLKEAETIYVCGECKTMGRSSIDGMVPVRWPCTTARLVGEWPGEPTE